MIFIKNNFQASEFMRGSFLSLIFIFILFSSASSQNISDKQLMLHTVLQNDSAAQKHVTPLVTKSHHSFIEIINPVYWVLREAMLLYQSTLSEQISSDCDFSPSCSGFSKEAIRTFGLIKGVALSADRLTRCNG